MDKAPFTFLELGTDGEGDIGSGVGDEETCGLLERDVVGDREEVLGRDGELFGVAALSRSKDAVANLVRGLGLGVDLCNHSCELFVCKGDEEWVVSCV